MPVTSAVKDTSEVDNTPEALLCTTPAVDKPEKVIVPDEVIPVAPVTAPTFEMLMEGVAKKLVKPVAEAKLMPLMILALLLTAEAKLMPFKVLALLVLVALFKV